MPRDAITSHYKQIFKFFLISFDIRHLHSKKLGGEDTNVVENSIIDSFIQLVIKLNESLFKPLFLKTVDWGTSELAQGNAENEDVEVGRDSRLLFTYRLVDRLLDRLKSIVAPYYGCLLENALEQLKLYSKKDGKKPDALWNNVMASLHKSMLHDNDGTNCALSPKT